MAKSIKDELDQFESDYEQSDVANELSAFESQQESDPTVEDKYLGGVYKGIKNLGYLAKPVSFMATPVLEAARAPLKYVAENVGNKMSQTPDIRPGAEYDSFYPSDRATTTNILTDLANAMGIRTSNIADVESEDFPKAAQFAENMTNPYNISGALLDTLMANKMPSPQLKMPSRQKMALEYLRAKSKDKALLQKMEESGKVRDAAALMASNPREYIRPFSSNKTLDYIEGPLSTTSEMGTAVTSTKRDTTQGKIGRLLEDQNLAIENIPDTHVVPKGDLAIAAKANLRDQGLLPTQLSSAEKMIDDIIGVMQPSSDKIKLIKKVEDVNQDILRTSKEISDEVALRVSELGGEKFKQTQRLIDPTTGQEIPQNIPNPNYREDLQWLSKLPVESDVSGVYPRNIQKNVTSINKEMGPLIPDINQEITTETLIPRELNVTPKNQKILDIVQGKQNEPAIIPNKEYQLIFDDISNKLYAIDSEIESINKGNIPATKKYSRLFKLNKKKKSLEDFYYKNLDDSAINIDQYMDFIDKQNLRKIGYSSDIRRQGNKLMSAVGNETPQEMGAGQAAGRALEFAGRKAQETAMDMAPKVDSDLYNIRNKEIAANIAIKDLMGGQRISPQNKLNVPVMDMARGAARQLIDFYPEYAAPYVSKAKESLTTGANAAMKSFKYPLPMQLVEYQIPRNSDEILANKDIVLAKIAQMSNDPALTSMFADALNKYPEKLKKTLPAIIMQFPDLFEDDDYNRIDGKIYDPMMVQKALKDIKNNKNISVREKAFKSKRLQEENILE